MLSPLLIVALAVAQIRGLGAAVFIGGFAIKVWFTGVNLTKIQRLHGTPAKIIAAIFMLIALLFAVMPFFLDEPA